MISVSNELYTTKQAISRIRGIFRRFKHIPKVEVGFDFICIKNVKCTHIIYIVPSDIEKVINEFKIRDYELLCLRFCEVV